ncbi:hypothetical protein DVH26_06060 [Paenibacillus sp. H1-7]|uniref:hypothetical protein n=1 Tax=Paenibacillus sp. H1-7 TaxID=2282849 RepID=UPI001EF81524|nr:hypothetical protein [Paenibacillus sp. H1-7]ULL14046.1 hypothetical protein DVH26_06060 [Paenibacillus sp. H1-7]
MILTLVVIGVAVVIAVMELPALIRKRMLKETIVFTSMLAAGTVLSVAAVRIANLPSPLNILKIIYGPLSNLVFH